MSIVSQAILAAYAAAAATHGVALTYCAGEIEIPLTANPGKTEAEALNADTGLMTVVELQDWLIRKQDLVHEGRPIVPERGHKLRATIDEVEQVFLVTHPDRNQAVYRRSDAHGIVLRVHSLLTE